ncbi:MAG: hypothetical protein EPN76_05400 [Burkholderiaceae bacterium]|nr:MAG: hypothetical protein EPN76_05400 [Burkholderiaceae bacterium]
MTRLRAVTWALGLRSTPQSIGVIGRDLGVFKRHNLDLQIVREETAGPEGARGLINNEYDFAEFGTVPIVRARLDGGEPLILLAAEQQSALYILSRNNIKIPQELKSGCLGVLSVAGQTGHSAKQMLSTWHLNDSVELVPCSTYPNIYQRLAEGTLHAGVLTADYRIAGEIAFGLNTLADLGEVLKYQGPVVATTARLRDTDPNLVQAVVDAYCDTLNLFRTSDSVVPSLQKHLRFADTQQATAIHAYYAKRFQAHPFPSVDGLARVIESMQGSRNTPHITPMSLCDTSFLERSLVENRRP